jgi:hypothetical protein
MSKHRKAYEELVLANGWLISALAWHGYLNEGRGAVQFREPEAAEGDTMMIYVSDEQMQVHCLTWPTPHEAAMVRTYNPETTVVLIFPQVGGGVHSCYGCFTPAPPAAYRQIQPRLEEFILTRS